MVNQHPWLNASERRQPNVHNRLSLHVRREGDNQAKLARRRISAWFSDWDDPADSDMASRLNSELDEQFISAVWELYVNSLLKNLGFSVTRLKQAEHGSRPDFLAEHNNQKFYFEASAIHPPKTVQEKIWNSLQDRLSAIRRNDVVFGIWPEIMSQSTPKFSSLQHKVKNFLDAIVVSEKIENFSGPEERIEVGEWVFRIQAFRHPNSGSEIKAMIISGSGGAVMISDLEDLRAKLKGKGSKYKNLEYPLVLAVLENSFVASSDHWHRMGALYGREALLLSTDGSGKAESIRQRDGLWDLENGDSKVSAIILKDRLNLLWPQMGQPATWFNPSPKTDLTNSPLNRLHNFSVVGPKVEEVLPRFEWDGL
jgi:hypothetical protein